MIFRNNWKSGILQKALSLTSAVVIILIGLLVIIGWIYDQPFLKSLNPTYISMKVNTAISLILLGLGLMIIVLIPEGHKFRIFSAVLSSVVVIVATLTLLEYIFNLNLPIDEFFLKDVITDKTIFPGRMAFNTGICFILDGIVIFIYSCCFKSKGILMQIFVLAVLIISSLPTLAYIFGLQELETFAFITAMALHTAVALIILNLGILSYMPARGLISTLMSKGMGGFMARRTLPAIVLLPVIFVLFRLMTSQWNFWNISLDILSITLIIVCVFIYIIIKVADSLDVLDKQRTLSEDALRSSEKRFSLVFRLSPAPMLLATLENGEIIELNEAFSKLAGYPEYLMLKRTTTDLKLLAEPANWNYFIDDLKLRGFILNKEIKLKNRSNLFRNCLASFVVVDIYGEKCVIFSAIDITDIKEAQEKIKQSEKRFHSTLDNMMEGCQIIDFNWTYLYLNDTALLHGRKSKEELLGKNMLDAWPGMESTRLFRVLKKCMNERVPQVMRNEFVYVDGKTGWFELRIQPVTEGIFILSSDISQKITSENHDKLEKEVLEHLTIHDDLKMMITNVLETIKKRTGFKAVAIRIKDGADFPYYASKGFTNEFVRLENYLCSYDDNGLPVIANDGNPILECICGGVIHRKIEGKHSYVSPGGSFYSGNTTDLMHKTDIAHHLSIIRNRCNIFGYESVILVPIRSGNEIVGLLQLNDHRTNFFEDSMIPFLERLCSSIGIAIMRNKAEEEITRMNTDLENRINERTRQLLVSNKELESFAYSVSHDLRAPLRHIIGFSEKLDNEIHKENKAEVNRLIGIIKNSALRMNTLIDDLLSYSRLGRQELKLKEVNLNKIIEEIVAETREVDGDRKIVWNLGNLPFVVADQSMMYQLFQNLISNSLKFTLHKDPVVIDIGYSSSNEHDHCFYIKDNGAGFDMQYADKLFGVFQRLHSSKDFPGTGIGLANIRKIIDRHNGTIWAKGKVNEGAAFYFTLHVQT